MRTAGDRRLPGLDGLRAIAVTAVVVFHARPGALPGGFLGVDLFFVISGFLITRGLLGELASPGGLDLPAFYRRRMQRLFPPMLAMLAAVIVGAATLWPDEVATLRGDVPAALGYLANWHQVLAHRSYFATAGRPSPLLHLWSLAIEEQFYLGWPLLMILAVTATPRPVRRGRPARRPAHRDARRIAVLAVAGAAASTAWMWVLAVRGDVPFGSDASRLYFGSDTHAAGLFAGAALAALTAGRRPDRLVSPLTTGAGLLALLGLGWAFLRVSEFSAGLYRGGFLMVAVLCAVIVEAARSGNRLTAVLEWGPLRFLGNRSYAIYLWHWPVNVVTRPGLDLAWPAPVILVIRIAVPVALAELSYRLLEHRSRRVGRAFARLSVLPVRFVALPVAVTALLAVTVLPGRSVAAEVPPAASAPHPRAGPPRFTAGASPAEPALPTSPATSQAAPDPPARPLGQVLAVGDSVLLGAAPSLHADVRRLTVDAVVGRQARPTLAVVDSAAPAPDAVVIATGNNGVIDPRDLARTLRLLENRRVVLVTVDVPRDWQGPDNDILRRAAARHRGLVLFDWLALSRNHRAWFYDDGYHLRPAGADAFARGVAAALARSTALG